MTTYYVGIGGDNANAGTSWALRKATLNGAEDIPVAAGDTVYVGPGTYRELLTCDVSGTTDGDISYIGDYTGANTDGVGGVVRITGSNDDITATRNYTINVNSKNYRSFKSFTVDLTAKESIYSSSNGLTGLTLDGIIAPYKTGIYIYNNGSSLNDITIKNCYFRKLTITFGSGGVGLVTTNFYIENCIVDGENTEGILISRHKDVVVRNCILNQGVRVQFTDATNYVYNCIFVGCIVALRGDDTGDITEDYNTLWDNVTARTNTTAGAHSIAYPPLLDTRWFFELTNGGTMITPYDLASYSALIDVAGTTPTTADMRGTTEQGDERELGALEYDSTLDIEAGSGTGGAVKILPLGRVGL